MVNKPRFIFQAWRLPRLWESTIAARSSAAARPVVSGTVTCSMTASTRRWLCPVAPFTTPRKINNPGQIVGGYGVSGTTRGFLATLVPRN